MRDAKARYDAVVFDLFGTLVPGYSVQGHDRALARMASCLGVSTDDLGRVWRDDMWPDRLLGRLPSLEDTFAAACQRIGAASPPPDALAEAARLRLDFERSLLTPHDDVLPTLRALHTRGYRIGLVSNCSIELPILFPETELSAEVDEAVFSSSAHFAKPDARIYELVCEGLGVDPERCLYVGDGSDRELTGAAAVGMHPVLVRVELVDVYDSVRADVDDWAGPLIHRIGDVLGLL